MRDYLFTFRTVTAAQRGQLVLEHAGIFAAFGRTPKRLAVNGCGYSLRVHPAAVSAAIDAMHLAGVAYQRLFTDAGDGTYQEVQHDLL